MIAIDDLELKLYETIRSIVLLATGVNECILADQNAPAPSGAYATIRISDDIKRMNRTFTTLKEVDSTDSTTQLEHTIHKDLMAKVTVNFYRGQALAMARRLVDCTYSPDIQALLYTKEMGIMKFGSVVNTTALQSNQTEQRATIDLDVAYTDTYTTLVNKIDSVDFIVENSKGEKLTEINVSA